MPTLWPHPLHIHSPRLTGRWGNRRNSDTEKLPSRTTETASLLSIYISGKALWPGQLIKERVELGSPLWLTDREIGREVWPLKIGLSWRAWPWYQSTELLAIHTSVKANWEQNLVEGWPGTWPVEHLVKLSFGVPYPECTRTRHGGACL